MGHTSVEPILGIAYPVEGVAIDKDAEAAAARVEAGVATGHQHRVEPLVVIGRVDPVARSHHAYLAAHRVASAQRVVAEGQFLAR